MICPVCNSTHGTTVIGSRYRSIIKLNYRRHECLNPDCMHRFSTYEIIASDSDMEKSRGVGLAVVHGRPFGEWKLTYVP